MPARIDIVEGDITSLPVDAIVNAANEALAPGGGVCGAIHRKAGPELAAACASSAAAPPARPRCAGFRLPARHVIHAVGPVWGGGERGEGKLLADCYRNALNLAAETGLKSIAFPAISTGIYGFPADRAAFIAARTVRETLRQRPGIERVVFCCFGRESYELHEAALAATAPQD
ncbi:RNase III inhibitor [Methyloceanibacter superfactus]|uniref:RNase III inhibitor n=1 Tax=Methyloceanibacter superfactus TaxID=1774969 RepID=A0A1E3VR56_9HYPH|nr:macro domain-containing protein [Methyloceanibacter superfactus]ODR96005.1 RNase III inhibitor [Methyloceanibacter superfactus]